MAELLRRILPAASPVRSPAPVQDTDESIEYSFAVEYHGPPVAYDLLPRAVPIDIERIPTAAVVSADTVPDCRSLPVIQPIPSPDPLKKLPKDVALGSDLIVSPTSVIAFERDGRGCRKSASEVGSSGTLGFSDGGGRSLESSPEIDSSGGLGFSNGPDRSCELSGEVGSSAALGFSNGVDRSCELSGEIGSSRALGFSDGHNGSHESLPGIESSSALRFSNEQGHSCELSGEIETPGPVGCSNSCDRSPELSDEIGNSGALGSSHDFKESVDFSNDMNPPDWVSTESVLSSPFMSSEYSSQKVENCSSAPPTNAKRTSLVTFIDAHSSDMVGTESSPVEDGFTQERREPDSRIRKGSCYRCYKGNRFTEKEACIVCNAKYCSNCVLRAMGSMPEGRKCVTCIGYSIDESKRGNLGRCSRMLKRLISPLEIQQAMKAEKSCEANQLQPEHVYVNGKQLSQDEMLMLHNCPNPPNKLKPGRYWYDKVSGFWGKEGHKPCKIISPNLNVGGELMQDASNGNTGVFINNREITKRELMMLEFAKVHCAGNPHFWVHVDGSYQEEGQKNIRGNIWGKTRVKLLCSVLGLPFPASENGLAEEANNLACRNTPDYLERRILQKLLLVGCDGSGTSTIFKQAKFLYQSDPFSEEERENIKCMIQSNVYKYLGILLEGREQFEEEGLVEIRNKRVLDQSSASGDVDEGDVQTIYSISPKLRVFSNLLLTEMASGNLEAIFPAATREYAPVVEELWKHDAIQATYRRRSELQMLPSVASYFLERVVDISRVEYEPSNLDILYADGITSSNGLAHTDFEFPQSAYDATMDEADQHDPLRFVPYHLESKLSVPI
eukprot:TRINITY_DN6702_c1_g1_i3.p1 TRINITY_DN6702_c1_g1~~TRINITY_DN6702_c1_g1_i3.p1  ORF type:complete len:843 (-),score=116.60 TRINITY_DN6702_c1_g1_i3:316-2844(-)